MPKAARRILILGSHGQVGHELAFELSDFGEVTALDRASADLSESDALRTIVRHHRPDVIVNAAAYSAVDKAESEPELAHAVNATAPGVLADEAQSSGACLVHYSSDYVFDGQKKDPYGEEDPTGPLSVYGRSKLAGEVAVARVCQRHVIFRTSWVFGAHGSNFLKTILRLATERESLRVVADQFGAPTSARLIAKITRRFLEQMLSTGEHNLRWGLYHLAPTGETSWHGYARHVIARGRQIGIPLVALPDLVAPIATAEYPVAARRPANSRLNTSKLRSALGMDLPDWKRDVDQVIHELNSSRTR